MLAVRVVLVALPLLAVGAAASLYEDLEVDGSPEGGLEKEELERRWGVEVCGVFLLLGLLVFFSLGVVSVSGGVCWWSDGREVEAEGWARRGDARRGWG